MNCSRARSITVGWYGSRKLQDCRIYEIPAALILAVIYRVRPGCAKLITGCAVSNSSLDPDGLIGVCLCGIE